MENIKLSKQDSNINELDEVIKDESVDQQTRALCQLLKYSVEDSQEGRVMSSTELLDKLKQQRNLK